ncbi:RtcB family protein [Plebeiibacterium sediminum]|uniref:3'-phosphate/5'-hydroxy nucleic acid ligase n=1 Tax=Plebeiibacterium sediminum TaxID=2992112 RepID=A0AAE3M6G5_9BACT|nr:RtcB family protein [Plebeiobacterium sediminum]MCW3788171.1 RtcB family protein [Plebeiobacterium sediminum]
MKQVISTEKHPIKLWVDQIEDSAINQAKNLANLPFVYKHVALMPDAHTGYGMPIGGVLATKGVIIPNAVGVDIGCGMCAIKTNIEDMDTTELKQLMSHIRKTIPLGKNSHKEKQDESLMPQRGDVSNVMEQLYSKALCQLGTLGGGNHFIEIQRGSDGYIWVMIHSGSRNIGKQIADFYNKKARQLNERWYTQVPINADLAFLPIETEEAHAYMNDMQYCIDFAFANRKQMMEKVKAGLLEINQGNVVFDDIINIAHNYAAWENHYNENVLVHRKGATRAYKGEIGIIPGSQGTKSYIVEGLGNPESFMSCSHGAGRVMGRKQAQRELDLETEISRLNEKGIIHAIRNTKDLDEAAGAYKDIDVVMANQKDLVKIKVELKPLAVVKG